MTDTNTTDKYLSWAYWSVKIGLAIGVIGLGLSGLLGGGWFVLIFAIGSLWLIYADMKLQSLHTDSDSS